MASPAQIAANRVNSRKSTGPTSPKGRANSSMNALKHGNRSRKVALLREESCAFEERLRKWMVIGDAQNDVEEYLIQGFWQSHDRLKASRLLGRQPVEANDDRRVAMIFVANHALGPGGETEFDDLLSDMHDTQQERYGKAVRERLARPVPDQGASGVETDATRPGRSKHRALNAKLEVREQNADDQAERSPRPPELRSQPRRRGPAQLPDQVHKRAVPRNGELSKVPGQNVSPRQRRTSASRVRTGPQSGSRRGGADLRPRGAKGDVSRWAEPAGQVDEAGQRERWFGLGADDSFESGGGQHDRLVRADVIDSTACSRMGMRSSGWAEFDENAPNKANFDEMASSVEPQAPIQVTANLRHLSGLDNGAAQPGEGTTPEQGEALGSGSESGGAEPPTPVRAIGLAGEARRRRSRSGRRGD